MDRPNDKTRIGGLDALATNFPDMRLSLLNTYSFDPQTGRRRIAVYFYFTISSIQGGGFIALLDRLVYSLINLTHRHGMASYEMTF